MKPIRDYSDGQWLLLLWFFVVLFLVAGLAISTTVLVVAVLGTFAAAYSTFLYVAERTGRSTTLTVFGREIGPPRFAQPRDPDADADEPDGRLSEHRDTWSEGGTP